MAVDLQRLLPFVPPVLARRLIAQPEWDEQVGCHTFDAAIVFADISGFTPLTERLSDAGGEGPEELTRLLNQYFTRLIKELEAEAGEVVKFSGDALIVLFSAEQQDLPYAIRRAQQAAQRMQNMLTEMGPLNSSVGPVKVEIKIGIGVGAVYAMEVGGLLGRWEFVVAGQALQDAAHAQTQAKPGDIIFAPGAEEQMHPKPVPSELGSTLTAPQLDQIEATARALRRFIPGSVLGWLETGDRNWLGVLRPMTVLFMGIKEFAFDDDDSLEIFHELIRNVQRALYRFEGSLNKVAVDDKGVVIMALFGAPPLAHEDDALRGTKAALEVQGLARKMNIGLRIGVTTGQVFAGPVGSEIRYEYTVMGDSVNLAARLMEAAEPGQVLLDSVTRRGARDKINIKPLPDLKVKGKSGRVKIYQPDDARLTSKIISGSFRPPPMMVGREDETAILRAALDGLPEGKGHLLLVEGDPGMGKTRLIRELSMQAKAQGLRCLASAGKTSDQSSDLMPWRGIVAQFFDLAHDQEPQQRLEQVENLIKDLAPGLSTHLPLLRHWLNLGDFIATQELMMNVEQRNRQILEFIQSLLRAWADSQPLVILLDDAQWLDAASWQLLLELADSVSGPDPFPLVIAVASRPMSRTSPEGEFRERLNRMSLADCLSLQPLGADHIEMMIADRLSVLPQRVPRKVARFVYERSEGSPFVAEELLRAMLDQGLIEVWKDEKTNQNQCQMRISPEKQADQLPGSVKGLILSRIDRMSPDQQLTLKVAAVLGRRFAASALYDVLEREQGFEEERVQRHLDSFADIDLVEVESSDPDLNYRFRHEVTREVAYDSMLYAQRRQLHEAAANWLEDRFGCAPPAAKLASLTPGDTRLSPYFTDLARHYKVAGNSERELAYSVLAGRNAAELYQNEEAERYLTRALELVPEDAFEQRFVLLSERESMYRRLGRRAARKADLQEMQAMAKALDDSAAKSQVAARQAMYQLAFGRVDSALQLAESAIVLAEMAGSVALQAEARRWTAAAQQAAGDHLPARENMEKARALAEQLDRPMLLADIVAELARFAEKRGDFAECESLSKQALELAKDVGDPSREARSLRRIASAYLATGKLTKARDHARIATELQAQIGDLRQAATSLELQGRIALAGGDYSDARRLFEQTLSRRQELQDRPGQQQALMLLGEACFALGAYENARICFVQAREDAVEMSMAFDHAEVDARLMLLEHAAGDNEKAKAYGLEAARTLSKLNDLPLLGTALTQLGHSMIELGEFDSAAAAFGNAQRIRSKLGQQSLLMETVAGRAQLNYKQGRSQEALEKVHEILEYFGKDEIGGVSQPFRIYQICFEILEAENDPAAGPLIEKAFAQLERSAQAISDETARENFQQNVPENRAIAFYYRGYKQSQSE